MEVELAGVRYPVAWGETLEVGCPPGIRVDGACDGGRGFLQLASDVGLWWLKNVGSRISATVTDVAGSIQSCLPPGGRLPFVLPVTTVMFVAGPRVHGFEVHLESPPYREVPASVPRAEATDLGVTTWTTSQLQLIVALAEPLLLRTGAGLAEVPSSVAAARRLGWATTRFNRKLDNVCDKLDRLGVPGVRGGPGSRATARRLRLVEYAVGSRLVTPAHLALLGGTRPV